MTPVTYLNREEEDDLVLRCLGGDRKAQEALYNMFSGKMYAICLRYTSNPVDAQDVMQDIFLKAFQRMDTYKGNRLFEGWLKTIAVRSCIEFHRQTKPVESENVDDLIEDTSLSGFDKMSAQDLMNMISNLSDGYRAVVNLYLVEGYSHKEIGEMLGIAEVTSRTQLARGKSILQKQIDLFTN